MNCTTVRQHLLASERPGQPAAALASHLAGCSACRGWQRRLVRLEQDIPRLPVPPSEPPASFLEQLRHGPSPGKLISPPFRLRPNPDAVREGGRQKVALAFALAASLVVFALGWWAWPRQNEPRTTQVVVNYQERLSRQLVAARNPRERVAGMADLAEELLRDAREQQARPGRVAELAFQFELLGRDLHGDALRVPLRERVACLGGVAERLRRLESQASQLAVEWAVEHGDSARSLRRIAAAAREADRKLTALVRGARV
jgi:hypothetical protein